MNGKCTLKCFSECKALGGIIARKPDGNIPIIRGFGNDVFITTRSPLQASYTSYIIFSLFRFGLLYCVIFIFHRSSWSIYSLFALDSRW